MSKQPVIRHVGIIRDGRKVYYNPQLQTMNLQQLEGKEFEEIITEKFVKASAGAHGFYRGGIIATCLTDNQFAGWTEDECHDYFANMFLKRVIEKIWPDGHRSEFTHIDSTADLNVKEMAEYIMKVQAECSHMGIILLSPEEYRLTKYRIVKT